MAGKTILYLIYGAVMNALAPSDEYCAVKCPGGDPHIMCQNGRGYATNDPTGVCNYYVPAKAGLSEAQMISIVDFHNAKRQYVASGNETRGLRNQRQPAAVEMPKLEWDNELAALAQQLANRCENYDNYQCSNTKSFGVGQNVVDAVRGNFYPGLPNLLDEWYNEVNSFDPKFVGNYKFKRGTRRYAQMVSARTTKIGCGMTLAYMKHYRNHQPPGQRYVTEYHTRLVCNYGPGGLVENQPLYAVRDN